MISHALSVRLLSGVILFSGSLIAGPATNPVTNLPGYTFTTIAGNPGVAGSSDGQGTNASFNSPTGIAFDAQGNLYVTDTGNNTIREIDTKGNVTTLAGSVGNSGYLDVWRTNALFNSPRGIIVPGTNGIIYIADSGNNLLRALDNTSGNVTTFAGVYSAFFFNYYTTNSYTTVTTPIYSYSGFPATPGNFGIPLGICYGTDGKFYVTQQNGASYNTGGEISPVSLPSVYTYNYPFSSVIGSGIAFTASGNINQGTMITGITSASDGSIYFVSNGGTNASNNSYIGMFPQYIQVSVPVAGNLSRRGNADRPGTNALFNQPTGIAVDQWGDLFVSDSGNNSIRMIFPGGSNNQVVTLSRGDGLASNAPNSPGSSNGTDTNASFNAPQGVAATTNGVIYIVDTGNHTIRKGVPPAQRTQKLLSSTKLPATGQVGIPLTFKASYSSGLQPVLSSSDNYKAYVSGLTVNPVGVGTVTITASQPGNVFYQPLPLVVMKLVISKGPQTVSFTPITNTLTFGDRGPFVPCSAPLTQLPVTLTSSDTNVITCSYSSGYADFTIVGAGLATVTAQQVSGNARYLPSPPVHQVLKVNKASQFMFFSLGSGTLSKGTKVGLSASYYPTNPPVKFTSGNPKVISISGTNATAIGAGTTTIVATHPGDKNYLPATPVTNTVMVY